MGSPVIAIVVADESHSRTIGSTLAELRETLDARIYVVPSGRLSDRAVEVAKDLGAMVVTHASISELGDLSKIPMEGNLDPEYVIFTTGDFKYPAKYVLEMIQTMKDKTRVGMVIGNRLNNHIALAANHGNLNGRFAGLHRGLFQGTRLKDPSTSLRVARWEAAKNWNLDADDLQTELNKHVKDAGYRIAEFPISIRLPLPFDATVIVPTLNEEKNISELLPSIRSAGFANILVIDGNSKDKTAEIAERSGVSVIYQNGRGKGDALVQAFGHESIRSNAVAMMDADGSMDPHELPLFIEALEIGNDVVKGSRNLKGAYSEDMSLIRRIGNTFFVLLTNLLWSANYTDLCYGFAVFRKDALKKLYPHLRSKNFEIETEIFIRAKKLGLRVAEVPSIERRRKYGKSNLKAFTDGLRILITIVREFIKQK